MRYNVNHKDIAIGFRATEEQATKLDNISKELKLNRSETILKLLFKSNIKKK